MKQLQLLWNWFDEGKLSDEQLKLAFKYKQYAPDAKAWSLFTQKMLLGLGLACLVCGVIFFFAYNWEAMNRSHKFLLIQVLIIVSTIGLFFSKNKQLQTALSLVLMMLVGILFAFFGQTYQTGKDPWELFFNWFLVTLPISIIVGKTPNWLLSIALLNLSLVLLFDVDSVIWGVYLNDGWQLFLIAAINFLIAESLHFIFLKNNWIDNKLVPQVVLTLSLFAFCLLSIYFIFEPQKHIIFLFSYICVMSWLFYQYRIKSLDLLIISAWVLSGIAFVVSLTIRLMDASFDAGGLFVIALLITGLSTIAGRWLMSLKSEKQKEMNYE